MQISFDVDKWTHELIMKVMLRCQEQFPKINYHSNWMDFVMDMTACHANGCPVDWARLLEADDFNFIHDVGGIQKHLNRETGKLGDMFLPRFALPEAKRAA